MSAWQVALGSVGVYLVARSLIERQIAGKIQALLPAEPAFANAARRAAKAFVSSLNARDLVVLAAHALDAPRCLPGCEPR